MNNLITDIGENYEYLRTIAHHQIELKKLDFIEDASRVASGGILLLLFTFLGLFLFSALSVLAVILLSSYLGSAIFALLSYVALLITAGLLIYLFRFQLIISPITNIFFSLIKNKI